MGPPRSKNIAALQARSRFCEGSMNDRTSAAPPMHFLGPDAIGALEQPVPLHHRPQDVDPTARYSTSSTATQSSTQTTNRLSGSKLLGQVWDGLFRGKRRSRRGDVDEQPSSSSASAGHMTRSKTASTSTPASGNNFASREEVLANYNQLVAEGFFKAKAVHCTRQPGPPPSVPAPKPPAEGRHARRPSTSDAAKEPETWPLPAAAATATTSADTPAKATRSISPVRSPASASSRGTKRAAADDDDDEEDPSHESRRHNNNHSSATADKENVAPAAAAAAPASKESQPKKRLRTIASRDGLFMPKLRSVASRRNMQSSSRRSISASEANSARETNKLSKRPPPQPGASSHPSTTARGMFDMPLNYQPRNHQHHLRPTLRNVSDGGGGGEQRVLRSQRSLDGRLAPLTVVPDANRGIPGVPAIPPKFTYGEDRENGTPWRGLRIR